MSQLSKETKKAGTLEQHTGILGDQPPDIHNSSQNIYTSFSLKMTYKGILLYRLLKIFNLTTPM